MHRIRPDECILPEGKYIVVGDLQNGYGCLDWLEQQPEKKLFLGDFLDSWDLPPDYQIVHFERVLRWIEQDKAIAVYGNHDAQYYIPGFGTMNGYQTQTRMLMLQHQQKAERLLRPFLWHPHSHTLFSHAGLTLPLWRHNGLTIDNVYETLFHWSCNLSSPFYNVGRARGGHEVVGGLMWCDWDQEFVPIPEVPQVVGHTSLKRNTRLPNRVGNLRYKDNSWNVDCLGQSPFQFLVFDTADSTFHGLRGPLNIF